MAALRCHNCGYDLDGVPDYGVVRVCPECSEVTPTGAVDSGRAARNMWLVPIWITAGLGVFLFAFGWIGAASFPSEYQWMAAVVIAFGAILNGAIAAAVVTHSPRSGMNERAFEWTGHSAMSLAFFCAVGVTVCVGWLAVAVGAAVVGP